MIQADRFFNDANNLDREIFKLYVYQAQMINFYSKYQLTDAGSQKYVIPSPLLPENTTQPGR